MKAKETTIAAVLSLVLFAVSAFANSHNDYGSNVGEECLIKISEEAVYAFGTENVSGLEVARRYHQGNNEGLACVVFWDGQRPLVTEISWIDLGAGFKRSYVLRD